MRRPHIWLADYVHYGFSILSNNAFENHAQRLRHGTLLLLLLLLLLLVSSAKRDMAISVGSMEYNFLSSIRLVATIIYSRVEMVPLFKENDLFADIVNSPIPVLLSLVSIEP
ncbi:hypothetical protein P3T76_002168 [Phytophthora citrophthora]|uniref:Uncharacterized protein n=1 Tax=Phytophthora citrophthora TaxID=4793 RepID=A0AAD9GXX7_9STRA|nr:hypothetical protein P3T76_002168 [Phytophthora citrophthora]